MLIIGEKINASIPAIREMIINHDGASLKGIAVEQEKAGADFIDINVGTGQGSAEDEINDIKWLVTLVKEAVNVPLCIDSADHGVLEAGLKAAGDRAGLVNSVKATDKNISEVFSLAAEFKVPVIALTMDEKGIPRDVSARLKACEKIAEGAVTFGIPLENIFFDPLVMPVSTDVSQGMITLETLREIKTRFPEAKTVLALSNVSFGLPKRLLINTAMLHMAMFLSVDALIINPVSSRLRAAIRAGDVVLGRDNYCRKYTRAVRQGILKE